MKIVELKAQNIKNLKAVEIRPDGTAVILTGQNGAGKSAILDSIFTALTGKKLDEPIRKGEERAEVSVDLDEFIVRKVITQKGDRLEVMSKDGDIKKSPQTFLNEVFGKLSFDPLEFARMKAKDQREQLKELVGLDFTDIDTQQKAIYDDRTVVNGKIKELIALLKNTTAPDLDLPEEEMSFKDQVEKVNKLREKREAFIKAQNAQKGLLESIFDKKAEIDSLKAKIASLEADVQESEANLSSLVMPPEVSEAQIMEEQDKLSEIEDQNVRIRAANRYRKLLKESEKTKEESDKLTNQINRLEQDKSTRVANAKFPIEGLSLADDGVTFKGIPFSQLSTGQQIRVSTAIAMALNPHAKIILCREGSLLDTAGMNEVVELAKEKDYQLWIERVDDTGKVGFHIENGAIKSINGEEVKVEQQASEETREIPSVEDGNGQPQETAGEEAGPVVW